MLFGQRIPPNERAAMRQRTPIEQLESQFRRIAALNLTVDMVEHAVAIHHIGIEVVSEAALQRGVVVEPVAAVQKQEVVALGVVDALVHGIVDALVRLAHPIGKVAGMLLKQFAAAVSRATVDDDPLEVITGLRKNAVNGLLEAFAIIVVDGDDGEAHGAFNSNLLSLKQVFLRKLS